MMPRRRRTRHQCRTAAIIDERRHNRDTRNNPPTPNTHTRCDEDLVYDDTIPVEPIPPPF